MRAQSIADVFRWRRFSGVIVVVLSLAMGGCPDDNDDGDDITLPSTLNGTITVQNLPCVAPSTGNVSCTFFGAATGGTPPYNFAWKFVNPANNQEFTMNGQSGSPALGCGFSSGVVTFNVSVTLTVSPSSGGSTTVTGAQQVARAAGACGT